MRKKDYELIASMLAEARNGEVSRLHAAKHEYSVVVVNCYHQRLVAEVADRLASTNPKFDRQAFIAAAEG